MENRKLYLSVIAALAVLLVIAVIWKIVAVKSVERAAEEKRIQLLGKARQVLDGDTRYFLKMTATPLVWAIRKEMLRDNNEYIGEYLAQFVKKPRIKQISVARPDGVITVSTDKKLEGAGFSPLYPRELLQAEDIVVQDDKEGNILVAAPVMGFTKRLGTLLLVYEPSRDAFDKSP